MAKECEFEGNWIYKYNDYIITNIVKGECHKFEADLHYKNIEFNYGKDLTIKVIPLKKYSQ